MGATPLATSYSFGCDAAILKKGMPLKRVGRIWGIGLEAPTNPRFATQWATMEAVRLQAA
jgi:hypothetical protein